MLLVQQLLSMYSEYLLFTGGDACEGNGFSLLLQGTEV